MLSSGRSKACYAQLTHRVPTSTLRDYHVTQHVYRRKEVCPVRCKIVYTADPNISCSKKTCLRDASF